MMEGRGCGLWWGGIGLDVVGLSFGNSDHGAYAVVMWNVDSRVARTWLPHLCL